MDIFDEQENYEEDCFSDEIEEIKNLSISSSISNDLNSNAKLFLQKTDICQNEKLTNITFNTIQTIILSNAKFPIKPQKSF